MCRVGMPDNGKLATSKTSWAGSSLPSLPLKRWMPKLEVPEISQKPQCRATSAQGVALAVAAYGLWGLIPLYFKLVAHLAPIEVLAHRMAWSFVVLVLAMTALRRWSGVMRVFRSRRLLAVLAMSALLLALTQVPQ